MIDHLISWLATGLFLATGFHLEAAPATPFEVRAVVEATTPGAEAFTLKYPAGQVTLHLDRIALLDHRSVKSAKTEKDPLGYIRVTVSLTTEGAQRIKDFSTKHVGDRLAIMLGGRIESAPFIREPILGGIFTITGNFSETEANELVRKLNEAAQH